MIPDLSDEPREDGGDTGVQMPAFAALVDDLVTTLDAVLERLPRSPALSAGTGEESPRLVVTQWAGPNLRGARTASLGGNAGTFAVSCCAFPDASSSAPVFSFEYLVVRERLQLVALDLLDTDAGDDSWSRDQLRRARRILELPVTPAHIPALPAWALAALSPAAIVVAAPQKLPAAGLVRRAVVETLDAFLACPRQRLSAPSAARAALQNRFHEAMLKQGPGLSYFRDAFGPAVDELATSILFPLVPGV